jgi:co-chaperonin GroES (HSP10)
MGGNMATMQGEITPTREEKERRLDELAQELYATSVSVMTPNYPWVLVRIMPKAQQMSGIWVPEKQNKTFYEGIVLETWKPFRRWYGGKVNDHAIEKSVLMESSVKRGDRVLFMHFEGQPVPWLDELHYRMIHEIETHPNGGIWGTLDFAEDHGLKEKLDKLFKNHSSKTISGK